MNLLWSLGDSSVSCSTGTTERIGHFLSRFQWQTEVGQLLEQLGSAVFPPSIRTEESRHQRVKRVADELFAVDFLFELLLAQECDQIWIQQH